MNIKAEILNEERKLVIKILVDYDNWSNYPFKIDGRLSEKLYFDICSYISLICPDFCYLVQIVDHFKT